MRAVLWLACIALLAACGHAPTSAPPDRNDLMVVLPDKGGKAGAVVVHYAHGERVLDTVYAAIQIKPPGEAVSLTLDRARVETVFGAALNALPAPPASFVLYFLEGSDELAPESRREMARLGASINSRPAPEIAVVGHTDLVGSDQYNDALSLQRAERVREELVRAGIAADQIEVLARGKREPLYRTSDGVAEPRNRRVEIGVR